MDRFTKGSSLGRRDDRWLVDDWKNGDESAATELFRRHYPDVCRMACVILDDWDDAEDVAQETLIYALGSIDRYDPDRAGFETWLHVIARSRCNKLHRLRRRLGARLAKWLGQRDRTVANGGSEWRMRRSQARDRVWEAVQELSPRLREAVYLYFWKGCTLEEMSKRLQCPVQTARSRVRLAYDRLRSVLAPDLIADLGRDERIER